MAFGRRQKKRSWIINGQPLEQVSCFKYLGMALQSTGVSNAHIQYAAIQGEKNSKHLPFYSGDTEPIQTKTIVWWDPQSSPL